MHIVTYENRLPHFCSLRLLVLSLRRHWAAAMVHVPRHGLPDQPVDWLRAQPNVTLHDDMQVGGEGWNVKVSILRQMLARLRGRVTWMDADIVVQSDPSALFAALDADDLVLCEESYRGTGRGSQIRTRGIGLPMGRELGFTANSCILSVTNRHSALLEDWAGLAASPAYLEQQARPYHERPRHYVGDQDLLTALLGSRDFAAQPLRRVRSGKDIAHSMLASDYPLGQRLMSLVRGEPPLAHAQGLKVWLHGHDDTGRKLAVQQSAYRLAAKSYSDQMGAEDRAWISGIDTGPTRVLTTLFPRRPSLAGLPLGLAGSVRMTLSKIKQAVLGGLKSNSGPVAQGTGPGPT